MAFDVNHPLEVTTQVIDHTDVYINTGQLDSGFFF